MSTALDRLKRDCLITQELALRGHRPAGRRDQQMIYRCPFPDHYDHEPSFTVYTDENRFKCFGCGRYGSVLDLVMHLDSVDLEGAQSILASRCPSADKHEGATAKKAEREDTAPPPVNGVTPLQGARGLTLDQLCAAKQLEVGFLESLGCRDSNRNGLAHVTIPYYNETGEVLGVRSRLAMSGDRFRWRSGDKVHPYGLDHLTTARDKGYLILVEGESDCWTCWSWNIPALGVPGKSTWRSPWADKLRGLDVFVWQEPGAEDLVERVASDLPDIRVIIAPDCAKDISELHVLGQDVGAVVEQLRADARLFTEIVRERSDSRLHQLEEEALSVMEAADPLELVVEAFRVLGYGGDTRPAELTYIAMTGRVLEMRPGSMPAHTLLMGPASSGKSFIKNTVKRLMPSEACHEIDSGSPRVLIYDREQLVHRVVIFGESDSLPAGEDNPAASAVRNLLQDHYLHYQVTVRDPESGEYVVQDVLKPGPTTLVTTAVKPLGPQLDTRLFTVEVPDSQAQIARALLAQAELELQGRAPEPDPALIAYQLLLQVRAPWRVVVPFADQIAQYIGEQPAQNRAVRDYARLMTLIKAVAVLRHPHRKRDETGRLVAQLSDYARVYELVADAYKTSATGASRGVREAVNAVAELVSEGRFPVTVTEVANKLGCSKMAASRRVTTALRGGWLTNSETRRGYPYRLGIGEPLPSETGLPAPELLACNAVTPVTGADPLVPSGVCQSTETTPPAAAHDFQRHRNPLSKTPRYAGYESSCGAYEEEDEEEGVDELFDQFRDAVAEQNT